MAVILISFAGKYRISIYGDAKGFLRAMNCFWKNKVCFWNCWPSGWGLVCIATITLSLVQQHYQLCWEPDLEGSSLFLRPKIPQIRVIWWEISDYDVTIVGRCKDKTAEGLRFYGLTTPSKFFIISKIKSIPAAKNMIYDSVRRALK